MLRAIIADDDIGAADDLRDILKTDPRIISIEVVTSFESLAKQLFLSSANVVFLDVEMGDEQNAIQAILPILADTKVEVIPYTGNSSYASDGYDVRAVDFIQKPASERRVHRAITRVVERLYQKIDLNSLKKETTIMFRTKDSYRCVPFQDISFIETSKTSGVLFHLSDNIIIQSTEELSELIPRLLLYPSMMRTHRSYVVNLEQIDSASRGDKSIVLRFRGLRGKDAIVSEKYVLEFRKRFHVR
ncbi:response regulator [Heliobacterium gestii]|uniref:Stage 0 sporulation protein A homolog n=1 Tax=Heliomicrobium gestii TaxID=2699 RepID=A0A845LBI5_HELGE|nr:LytTR family DNA-binding domain-containing protein [Heliomicrobium gestii]MBM7867764.1 two-component system LytT family response regulator [Heliomicrobium gestii]MZP44157.1 response regulator [Heliomicrobium gestii]